MKNKQLIVDCRISEKSEKCLEKMGFELIKIPQCNLFDNPVSAHPDMLMTKINNVLFIDSSIHDLFTTKSVKFVERGGEVKNNETLKYPYDIEFNCVQVGDKLICNKKYTNEVIVAYAEKNGITIIDVKQGYAKCSTCVVTDNAIITEDSAIAKKANEFGIEVLKISKGSVGLSGYDYGFIGGASGLIENKLLAFNGNILNHPDFERIFEFCYKHSVGIVCLSDEKLYDIGSIIRIY